LLPALLVVASILSPAFADETEEVVIVSFGSVQGELVECG